MSLVSFPQWLFSNSSDNTNESYSSFARLALMLFGSLVTVASLAMLAARLYVQYKSMKYIRNLTKPDLRYKKLTANKPICPYMGNVLASSGLRIRYVWPHQWGNLEAICREQLQTQVHNHVKSAGFIVVPFLPYENLMTVWRKLRLEAIPEGKMFGEFHPEREQTGLHSDCVFPLQTPFPSFGVRSMVPQDATFFDKFEEDSSVRQLFNDYFIKRWPQHGAISPVKITVEEATPLTKKSNDEKEREHFPATPTTVAEEGDYTLLLSHTSGKLNLSSESQRTSRSSLGGLSSSNTSSQDELFAATTTSSASDSLNPSPVPAEMQVSTSA